MYLLVGLGNPGARYEETRHNVGFKALSLLARRNHIEINQKKYGALIGRGRVRGEDCLLAMPQSYMNLSGGPVRKIIDYFKIPLDGLLVVYDEMDLELGKMKVTAKGRAGGHKGVASIIENLGSIEFARIKIGIGKPPEGWTGEGHVLGRFESLELEVIDRVLESAAEAAEVFTTDGVAEAQAQYNRKDLNTKGMRR